MFARFSERAFHRVRWVLMIGWLLAIASLFYDVLRPFFLCLDPLGANLESVSR
jgi:hypothetical protein